MIAWQKGRQLYIELKKDFIQSRDYSFNDQLFRAALSVTNNIAEGFDRGSDKELRYFLIISRGSCAEVRSMLHIALADQKINPVRHKEVIAITIDISRLLTGFIKSLTIRDKGLETNDKRLATNK